MLPQASIHISSDNKERDLKRERNAPSVEAERTKLKAEILQLTKKRIGIVTDYAVGHYLEATVVFELITSRK